MSPLIDLFLRKPLTTEALARLPKNTAPTPPPTRHVASPARKYQRWTRIALDELFRLHARGLSHAQIARELGTSEQRVVSAYYSYRPRRPT